MAVFNSSKAQTFLGGFGVAILHTACPISSLNDDMLYRIPCYHSFLHPVASRAVLRTTVPLVFDAV